MTEEEFAEVEQAVIDRVVSGLIPATAAQVGAALGKLSLQLAQVNRELTAAIYHAGQLSRDYQLAFDMALIKLTNPTEEGKPKYSVEAAKAMARIENYELGLKWETAKSEVQRLRNDFREVQKRILVGQTNAATVRSEMRTMGYGGSA